MESLLESELTLLRNDMIREIREIRVIGEGQGIITGRLPSDPVSSVSLTSSQQMQSSWRWTLGDSMKGQCISYYI